MEASVTSLKGAGGPASPVKTLKGSRTRSAPILAAAYNLRQYSVERGHGALLEAAAGKSLGSSQPAPFVVTADDLAGGNGRWRQQRAKEQWVLDQAEAERKQQEQRALAAERRRRRQEREARRRQQQDEDEQRRRAREEKQLRERLEREERERQEAEERRLRALQEQADRLARQPKTCKVCGGTGRCKRCDGKGLFFSMFLAPSVNQSSCQDTHVDYGRAQQGCPDCGGCEQNVCGPLKQGSGNCTGCGGAGKVTPLVAASKFKMRAQMTKTLSSLKNSFSSDNGGDHSPHGDRSRPLASPQGDRNRPLAVG